METLDNVMLPSIACAILFAIVYYTWNWFRNFARRILGEDNSGWHALSDGIMVKVNDVYYEEYED